ncbi:MAG: Gfo/Idh/MocA family oxidoreductase, partial [Lachnospiraceae bacterium]|nr:Gfo/Idh/MocA family oxidoreductase [Lachnospiraceae bacterium]
MSIRVGILGYGNLGRGVEAAVNNAQDMELVGVFTRRDPKALTIKSEGVKTYHIDELNNMTDAIDVLIICGGSATDLPVMTPKYAALYNVIDSFDTHANIPLHFENVDKAAKAAGKVGIIST